MKTPLAGRNAMSRIRVLLIATCIIAVTPRLSADIILLSRLSESVAYANAYYYVGAPPTQSQTGFLPANLSNCAYAFYPSHEMSNARASSTSNSSILINNLMEGLRVVGDGTASAEVYIRAEAHASAKLIVLSFTLTDVPYLYSMTGQLNGASCEQPDLTCATTTAKLTGETGTIFEKVGTTLSESGTLPPGNYTLSVDVYASYQNVAPVSVSAISNANFAFVLDGPASTPTPSPTPIPVARATNLSTRMLVGYGNNVGIGGFIITGTRPRHVLVRSIGPSLGGIITNAFPDPSLQLHGSPPCFQTLTNNNWRDTQEAEIIATGRPPSNDLDSAIVADLAPGAYTAVVAGNVGATGVGLIEIWDLSTNEDSKLANISTRGNVGTGNSIMIAGVIIGGASVEDTIIVRGLGPSLDFSPYERLPDPKLELRDSQAALIASDDNWMDDPNQAAIIQAFGLAPSNNLESAIAATLMPGEYTVLLSGVNNSIGLGLVEVYDNPAIGPTATPCPQCTPTPTASPVPTPAPTATPGPTPPNGPVLEAENAVLTGCYQQDDLHASNGFRVDGINAVGDSVEFTDVPPGTHVMFWYATPNNGPMSLYVDGVFRWRVIFVPTPGGSGNPFAGMEIATDIPQGSSVKLQFDYGDIPINLDYIQIY